MERILYERELHEPVRQYLTDGGFEVRSEVNDCDLVARREGQVVVVEMKRHLSFDLLAQAVERQSYTDAVYVCVPKSADFKLDKIWRSRIKVLKQLGLGLLLVGKTGRHFIVEEALAPEPAKPLRPSARKRQALDQEFRNRRLDLNIGGSRGVPLMTAYRESALFIACLLDSHGPLTPRILRSLGGHPKKTTAILNANHYGWFEKSTDQGFALTDAGREALNKYAPMITAFHEATECFRKVELEKTDIIKPKQQRKEPDI
jgi:hypothetical protein